MLMLFLFYFFLFCFVALSKISRSFFKKFSKNPDEKIKNFQKCGGKKSKNAGGKEKNIRINNKTLKFLVNKAFIIIDIKTIYK